MAQLWNPADAEIANDFLDISQIWVDNDFLDLFEITSRLRFDGNDSETNIE